MATISASLVKELRDRTGVGMGKCKEALVSADGDIEAAIDILRKQGQATAVKKQGREAKEGKIVAAEDSETLAIFEVNSETDFVVNNEKFLALIETLKAIALSRKPKSLEEFLSSKTLQDESKTVEDLRIEAVQSIGENIQIRRFFAENKSKDASYGVYSHMQGKIMCLVIVDGSSSEVELAKDIAMHVAAEAPEYLNPEEIPEDAKEREREIAREQVQGKPANIIEKIIEGKLGAFYDKVCLLRQNFVKDTNLKVGELVDQKAKASSTKLHVVKFYRLALGEN